MNSRAILACLLLAAFGAGCNLLPRSEELVLSEAEAARVVAAAREFLEKQNDPGNWQPAAEAKLPPTLAGLTLQRSTNNTPCGVRAHDGHLDIDFMNGNDTRIGLRVYKAGITPCSGDRPTRYPDLFWYNLNTDLPEARQNCP